MIEVEIHLYYIVEESEVEAEVVGCGLLPTEVVQLQTIHLIGRAIGACIGGVGIVE